MAIDAVLDEQAKQWNDENNNKVNNEGDQAIADAYKSTTSSCQMWAQVVGKRDEESAEAIYYADEDKEDNDDATATTEPCSIKSRRVEQKVASSLKTSGIHREVVRAAAA
mmetsp:Transcript_33007/g.79824  ORF Transcript_33007/g.79824 Transcript_33007/m.79824 type:complete len:110 (-) Transcript_33007:143-472(-)